VSSQAVTLELLAERLEAARAELVKLRVELKRAGVTQPPGRLLSRSDLRELGLERRAIDAVFVALPVVRLPGYARPLIRESDYVELLEASVYADDRVRP
jgi:hypothetical protein